MMTTWRGVAVVACSASILLGCSTSTATAPGDAGTSAREPSSAASSATSATPMPTLAPAPTDAASASVDPQAVLAPLTINDGQPPGGYLRDLFPTWKDIDDDGCDARRQALLASSTTPAQVGERCAVISGTWTSAYDGATTTDPGAVQIDHVVPLANAWRSGADTWTTDQRTRFANDQSELWAVSAASNQSKGDRGPEQWRPPRHDAWCEYAQRWTTIKIRWQLTATTAERDALGQMLDTC